MPTPLEGTAIDRPDRDSVALRCREHLSLSDTEVVHGFHLKALSRRDFEALHALNLQAPEMTWDRAPTTEARTGELLTFRLKTYSRWGFGIVGVWTPEDELVGQLGLQPFDNREDRVELVIYLAPRLWGSGHGSSLCSWLLERAFVNAELSEVWAAVRTDNAAAQSFMEKLRFARVDERLYFGHAALMYRVTRDVWAARRAEL
jgi:RimJ/RimL family protein N-acetyltransferase